MSGTSAPDGAEASPDLGAAYGATAAGAAPLEGSGLPDTRSWTADRARAEIDAWGGQIARNRGHALLNRDHPQHKSVLAHWTRLHEIAHSSADAGTALASPRQQAPAAAAAGGGDQAKAEIEALRAEFTKDRTHPVFDKMHPQHKAIMDRWTALHEAAYGGAAPTAEPVSELALSDTERTALVSNHLNLANVQVDGQALNEADTSAGRRLATEAIVALDLPRADAGMLVTVLNASLKAPVSMEEGRAALDKELGSQGAEATIAEARRVVAYLEQAGVPAGKALDMTGAGNSAGLIKYLASLAKRLK